MRLAQAVQGARTVRLCAVRVLRTPAHYCLKSMFERMRKMEKASIDRLMMTGFRMTLTVLLLFGGIALNYVAQSVMAVRVVQGSIVLLVFLALMYARMRYVIHVRLAAANCVA